MICSLGRHMPLLRVAYVSPQNSTTRHQQSSSQAFALQQRDCYRLLTYLALRCFGTYLQGWRRELYDIVKNSESRIFY